MSKVTILQDILAALVNETGPGFPTVPSIRIKHEEERRTIDLLVRDRDMKTIGDGRYSLTMNGLRAIMAASEGPVLMESAAVVDQLGHLVEVLKQCYRDNPEKRAWSSKEISDKSSVAGVRLNTDPGVVDAEFEHLSEAMVSRYLVILGDFAGREGHTTDASGAIISIGLGDRILDTTREVPRLPVARLEGPPQHAMDSNGQPLNHNDEDLRRISAPGAQPRMLAAPTPATHRDMNVPHDGNDYFAKPKKPRKPTTKKAAKKAPKKKARK